MKRASGDHHTGSSRGNEADGARAATEPADADPGVPGLHTWRGVYLFVVGIFGLWVGLLTLFMKLFA